MRFPKDHANPAVVQVIGGGIVNCGSPSKRKHAMRAMAAMFNIST